MNEHYIKAMTWDSPTELPISLGVLAAFWFELGDEAFYFAKQYPDFFTNVPNNFEELRNRMPPRWRKGEWLDEWGCVWSNEFEGMDAYVTGHPVKTREDILRLQVPENDVDNLLPHGFMYLRLLDLRGFEEAMFDFADEAEELQVLIDKVVQYNLKQVDYALTLPKFARVLWLGDDNGMQTGLAIGAEAWRKYIKPAYTKIYAPIKAAGRLLYMHTDGCIHEIMPDLVDCGVDMINPQFRANGLDNLVRVCRGKIPINLDLDRQMFPFATPSQLRDHVRECVESLWLPQGGLGINCELNYDVPLENAAALLDALREVRHYKG
ncbi:MAG: uroporphyrinogen decarboxylase family protein [Oscillospiraceae bacterium]|nr:uroporphyrinogen decarboxylase family protein [Oscillospiraceae bacterium]